MKMTGKASTTESTATRSLTDSFDPLDLVQEKLQERGQTILETYVSLGGQKTMRYDLDTAVDVMAGDTTEVDLFDDLQKIVAAEIEAYVKDSS